MNLNPLKNNPLNQGFTHIKRVFYGLKCLSFIQKGIRLYVLVGFIFSGIMGVFPVLAPSDQQVAADTSAELGVSPEPSEGTDFEISIDQNQVLADFSTIQSNSLIPLLNPSEPNIKVVRRILVIATGYSSSPWETDDDPHITAAGTLVKDGIIASNLLPFGTKVMLPDIYGNKIFVVEDRMNSRKGDYQIDLWFPSRWEALNFGAKLTRMEIVEEI